MMRTLYLVRHTTPDVAPGICYGQLDLALAASFEHEAKQVLNWLPPAGIIMTSPLQRACKLAEYLAQTQRSELRTDERLLEKHFGAWEGRAWNDIERSELDAWAADVMDYLPPGGESARQLMLRVQALLHDIAQLPHGNIILVTHGGVIRAMLAQIGKLPLSGTLKWDVGYGAVTAVRY